MGMVWMSGSGAGVGDPSGRHECESCRVQCEDSSLRHCPNCGHTFGEPAPRRRSTLRRRFEPTLSAR
ncbi:MAG: hypothetical protein FJW90_04460 [Actinobacteria bacterium]|nr:hypothetical protein [Actinomycetota bacterium]